MRFRVLVASSVIKNLISYILIENTEEPQPTDVLIDILISFLARPSVLLRSVAEQAFAVFANDVTKAGLEIVLEVHDSR